MFPLIIAVLVLTACAEQWQKPGASEQDYAAIESFCQSRANTRFPPLYNGTVYGGHYGSPLLVTRCDRENPSVTCQTRQGDYVFPPTVIADDNLDARWENFHACLSENGWQAVP